MPTLNQFYDLINDEDKREQALQVVLQTHIYNEEVPGNKHEYLLPISLLTSLTLESDVDLFLQNPYLAVA